jgi:hypothetical protein
MTDDMDIETSGQEAPDRESSGGGAWDLLGDDGAGSATDTEAGHHEGTGGAGFGTRMPDRELGGPGLDEPGEGGDFDLGGTGTGDGGDATDETARSRH